MELFENSSLACLQLERQAEIGNTQANTALRRVVGSIHWRDAQSKHDILYLAPETADSSKLQNRAVSDHEQDGKPRVQIIQALHLRLQPIGAFPGAPDLEARRARLNTV